MKRKIVKVFKFLFTLLFAAIITVGLYFANLYNLIPRITYSADYFGIETIKSDVDFNNNGVDDYTDILLGARIDAKNHPKYDSRYWPQGYPPDDIGVCTDVVWRAFKNAGYSLRDMVDMDIKLRPEAYEKITVRDYNIDFRRVVNLRVYFETYAQELTLDITDVEQWQPGDIVIFGNDKHIGIVSDKRNRDGVPYVIHNGGQPNREEDYFKRGEVTGHYRFDASKISANDLVAWQE